MNRPSAARGPEMRIAYKPASRAANAVQGRPLIVSRCAGERLCHQVVGVAAVVRTRRKTTDFDTARGVAATSTFPCPSCGAERSTDRAACEDCGWPKKSASAVTDDPSPRRRIQFHLRSLLVFMTVACVVFAGIGRFGVDGVVERLEAAFLIALPFILLVEVYYKWKEMGMDDF